LAQQGEAPTKPVRPEPQRGQRQDLDLVKAFVVAGHADRNLARVKEYLSQDPKLVLATWDWGGGDWETALGGASHTGSREMARYLLSQGARIDSFCAAMLGQRQVVAALVASNPSVVTAKGPHGFTLLYHAAISGDVAMAEILKPHLGAQPGVYTQALSAAVRDGHLAMTQWLFANGDADPNAVDGLGKRPLTTAVEKGFPEVAQELRSHGAREAD
jgi:ankyrin repeat protein